jgi:outer membrane protein TolC
VPSGTDGAALIKVKDGMGIFQRAWGWVVLGIIAGMVAPVTVTAQTAGESFTLQEAIDRALKANIGIKRSQEDINAADAVRKGSMTYFLPTLGARYNYLHLNRERTQDVLLVPGVTREVVVAPANEYSFVTSFTQPIFTGFGLINQFKIADLGLDAAEISAKVTRQDVILDAKNAYYSVLKSQKLEEVARQTVMSIAAQKEVSENFYKVGLSPLNDLLQSQVQLANARQQLTVAQNNLEIARTQFNTVLRRPVNATVTLVEDLDYSRFQQDLEYCLDTALKTRLEVNLADLNIEIAQRQVKLTEKDFFPAINLTGAYTRTGDDWRVEGGEGVSDAAGWNIQATASWDFWQWGRTDYGRKEKLARLSQAKYQKTDLQDTILLQVKQAYLRTKEAEQNILTIERAVEQAKENLRITEEQYKEQVATQTDVLIAQTLLTQTMTTYYNALYDFKIAKAVLLRAIGQDTVE